MKYKALLPIKHNGKDYCVGDEIELEAEHSKQMLEIKAVILLATGQKENGGDNPPSPPVPKKSKKNKAKKEGAK